MDYLKTVFGRREGLITLIGSLVYLVNWSIYRFKPDLSLVPPFYGMLSLYVPVALGIAYMQMGGFSRKKFESGLFNTGVLLVILLVPFIVSAQSALWR